MNRSGPAADDDATSEPERRAEAWSRAREETTAAGLAHRREEPIRKETNAAGLAHRRDVLVDQAVGVLMARSGCGSAEALGQLADIGRRAGRSLADVAADVVAEASGTDRWSGSDLDSVRLRPQVAGLDRTHDADELAWVLVGEALGWSGAVGAAIGLLDEDGAIELVGSHGFSPREVRRWRRIPPALDCLMTRAARSSTPQWTTVSAGDAPPLLGEADPTAAAFGTRVAAPVRSGPAVPGVVEVAWPTEVRFDTDERREIEAVLRSVSQALLRSDGAASHEPGIADDTVETSAWQDVVEAVQAPALVLRNVSGHLGTADLRVVAFNRSASQLVAETSSTVPLAVSAPWLATIIELLAAVVTTGVPLRRQVEGQYVAAARIGEGTVLVVCGTPNLLETEHARIERLARVGSWHWDLRIGRARWSAQALRVIGSRAAPEPTPIDEPPYTVHPEDADAERRFVRTLTVEGRPAEAELRILRPDGDPSRVRLAAEPVAGADGTVAAVHGIVQNLTEWRRAETALEVAKVQLAAQRTRADTERRLASVLQQIIVPAAAARRPPHAGVEVVARYRPAGTSAGVGGDWYAVFPLRDSRLLLSVGDVAGHGLPAAAAMADLYHALRGLALADAGPGRLLTLLNELTGDLPDPTIASACCVLWDPAARRLAWADAGHPRPVRVRGNSAELLDAAVGPMLGVEPRAEYQEAEIEVRSGDVLLLYTDGLVERRRVGDDETTAYLLDQARDPDPDLEAYADRLLAGARSDTDDDSCVLAVRFD